MGNGIFAHGVADCLVYVYAEFGGGLHYVGDGVRVLELRWTGEIEAVEFKFVNTFCLWGIVTVTKSSV